MFVISKAFNRANGSRFTCAAEAERRRRQVEALVGRRLLFKNFMIRYLNMSVR